MERDRLFPEAFPTRSLARALIENREIIVLTRAEISALCDTNELVRLLKLKRAQLAVSGTIFQA